MSKPVSIIGCKTAMDANAKVYEIRVSMVLSDNEIQQEELDQWIDEVIESFNSSTDTNKGFSKGNQVSVTKQVVSIYKSQPNHDAIATFTVDAQSEDVMAVFHNLLEALREKFSDESGQYATYKKN